MTKAQEQDRLDRINSLSNEIKNLLHDFPHENDKAGAHLERAKAHLDEAWIDADGQQARTVGELVTDCENASTLFNAVVAAMPGDRFNIGGRVFVKQPSGRL